MSSSAATRGFTLVEVLVAVATVSALAAGAAGMLSTASAAIRSARHSTTATLLAIQKVEQLQASPSTLPSGTAQDYLSLDGVAAPAASAAFVRRWTVTPGWMSSENATVVVEVFATGAGRVAELQAVVGGGGTPS